MTKRVLIQIISHSPKLIFMLTFTLFFYVVAWHFGIRQTVKLIIRYTEMSENDHYNKQQSIQPEDLSRRIEELDIKMGCRDIQSDDIRQSLLDRLTTIGTTFHFSMVDIPAGYIYIKQEYQVMINTFVITGNYNTLLRLMYIMDTTKMSGSLISARMYSHKPYQTAEPELRLALFFQNLIKNHEAK